MRLINVDALKEDYHMADDCKDCKTSVRDCEYDHVYTKMDFCGWLDDAPSVDAVPVEWIEEEIKRLREMDNDFAGLTANIINTMLKRYKKEDADG